MAQAEKLEMDMPEHYADDYTMGLIAGTNPNPRVAARWFVPTVATPITEPETESVDTDEADTKVVSAPRRRGRKPATEAETA